MKAKKAKKYRKLRSDKPRLLGNELIYPPQVRVAMMVMEILRANERRSTLHKRSPIIIGQPQSGKTGAIEFLIALFVADCILRKRTFQIVTFCGLSMVGLAAQTRMRLTESAVYDGATLVRIGAKLDELVRGTNLHCYPNAVAAGLKGIDPQREGILVLHNNTRLRKLNLNMKVDVRLWIGDEVHLGNVKGGNIDVMLRNHGVRICEQIHTWDNSKTINHFVGVSATPAAHILKSDAVGLDGESLFVCVYETPGPTYNGLSLMWGKNRLRETEPLFVDKKSSDPTPFLRDVVSTFRANCAELGPGYLVIRATGRTHTQLMGYINKRGRRFECREFDASLGNIDELSHCLATAPAEPTVVVIRGSMRAGITLGLRHYIRGWVETRSVSADAPTQAGPGRACGYGRTGDTYPIYCDVGKIGEWVTGYLKIESGEEGTMNVPGGVQSKKLNRRKIMYKITIRGIRDILSKEDAWAKYVAPNATKVKASDRLYRYRTQIGSTKENVFLDVAGMFLEGRHDSGSSLGVLLDGPTSDEAAEKYIRMHSGGVGGRRRKVDPKLVWSWVRRNRASYKKLLKKHPDAKGKVIVFDIVETPVTGDELQRKTSALRSK